MSIGLFFSNFFCINSLAFILGGNFSFFRSVETLPLSGFRYFIIIAWWLGELKSITAFLINSKIENPPSAIRLGNSEHSLYPDTLSHELVHRWEVSFKAANNAPAASREGQYCKAFTCRWNLSIAYLASYLTRFFIRFSLMVFIATSVNLSKNWNALGIENVYLKVSQILHSMAIISFLVKALSDICTKSEANGGYISWYLLAI